MNDYQFQKIEEKVKKIWQKKIERPFRYDQEKKIFTILMPPPNVTGKLHLGHALNNFLQDTLVRFYRLKNYQTLWIPGLDHAGIATEIVCKKWINENNFKITKEKNFQWYIEKWVEIKKNDIEKQWQKLGLLINKEKITFSLDEIVKKKVQETFVILYQQNLIYRSYRLVNWDIKEKTAISDLEVEYIQKKGTLYYIKYFHENNKDFVIVATTRPETIFVDQALLFHPQDLRYQKWENQKFINPLTNELIPLIKSEKVISTFGSGILKCTPGHDFKDFEIGQEKKLKFLSCLNSDGTLNDRGLQFKNLDRFQGRKQIVAYLKTKKLLQKEQQITHNIPYSKRSEIIIEPFLSKQWFLKTNKWAQKMLTLKNEINFIPAKFNNYFVQWMKNCNDWCISRQLTWGHRLPVYFDRQGKIKVTLEKINSQKWKQSNDVLDTWFSSGLWSLVNFIWKNNQKTEETKLIPITYLVTSYDIIFFWVARMFFLHYHFRKEIPFQNILIHGLIRTKDHQKMSKSKGNVIDPLDLIKKYGVDALRFYLLKNHKIGEDLSFQEHKLVSGYNMMIKIWNLQIFIKKEHQKYWNFNLNNSYQILQKKMIAKKFAQTKLEPKLLIIINEEKKIIKFFEDKNWSVNIQKIVSLINFFSQKMIPEYKKINQNNEQNYQVLLLSWLKIICLLHPFVPFLTEYCWNHLHQEKFSILDVKRIISKEKKRFPTTGLLEEDCHW